jgi:putative ABC transport system ATP-binding protein
MLATKHLSRAVGGKLLVDDISVQVEAGEILAVVGSSGAGKSSFLRLLNRLDEPTDGIGRLTERTTKISRRANCADASAW